MENQQQHHYEPMAEFASHLMLEVLTVRDSLKARAITEAQALARIRAVRRRRMSGDGGLLRPSKTEAVAVNL